MARKPPGVMELADALVSVCQSLLSGYGLPLLLVIVLWRKGGPAGPS